MCSFEMHHSATVLLGGWIGCSFELHHSATVLLGGWIGV